jgi:hypothetical protein
MLSGDIGSVLGRLEAIIVAGSSKEELLVSYRASESKLTMSARNGEIAGFYIFSLISLDNRN